MPLCSVHTTVTLKVASRLVCVSAASAAAVRLGETPACHENQDYLNLFSWRSFTQTFPALSRKLVFFTALGGWVTGGGGGSGGAVVRASTCTLARHTHTHTHNNCLYTRMRTCTKAWPEALGRVLSITDQLSSPGRFRQLQASRGRREAPSSRPLPSALFNPTVTVTRAGSSASCSVLLKVLFVGFSGLKPQKNVAISSTALDHFSSLLQ